MEQLAGTSLKVGESKCDEQVELTVLLSRSWKHYVESVLFHTGRYLGGELLRSGLNQAMREPRN